MVCISDVLERKYPSLSASNIPTKAHSGISSPSLNKLIPISTSNRPSLKSRIISIRSNVSTSECTYRTLIPASCIYSVSASAIFLVRVVTKTRVPLAAASLDSAIISSTCVSIGLTIHSGSISPVGRTTCSTKTPPVCSNSHFPGVAET